MIDIIIPAYNAHGTIKNTLDSIIQQTIKDEFNVYIVDDASSENYQEIINEYSAYIKITEIRINENSGPGVARQVRTRKFK